MRSKTSRVASLLAAGLLTVSLVGMASTATGGHGHRETGPPDASVAYWDAVGTRAFSAAALTPAEGHTIFAYVAIAVYDSVMAVEGGYEPFLVDADAPDGASAEAAVAAAARGVLNHYLPGQSAAIVDPAYIEALAAIPDGMAESDGVAIGAEVAGELIALRADDGFRASRTHRCRASVPRRLRRAWAGGARGRAEVAVPGVLTSTDRPSAWRSGRRACNTPPGATSISAAARARRTKGRRCAAPSPLSPSPPPRRSHSPVA